MVVADEDGFTRLRVFTKETSSRIPEVAGVYGWLFPLWLYEPRLSDQLRLVHEFAVGPDLTGRENIDVGWDRLAVALEKSQQPASSALRESQWTEAYTNEAQKRVFEQSLLEASLLMPPLYVGKADSLRTRYANHVEGRSSPFHDRFTAFVRERKLTITVSDLLFVCVPMSGLQETCLHELLEYFLIRATRPPFSDR